MAILSAMAMRRVYVLGGSEEDVVPEFVSAAREVGRLLADNGLRLVYSGSGRGISGALAEAALSHGGAVEGILAPEDLERNPPPAGLTELVVADSESERDAMLVARADAVLALPEGMRSLRRLETLCISEQPGAGQKPCGLLNTGDFYTALLKAADDDVLELFARESQRGMLIVDRDPAALLRAMADFRPPETRRLESRDDNAW
jgi:uncharacterized protein (TIGR00730 family)